MNSQFDTRATILTAMPGIFAPHDSTPALTLRSIDLAHEHRYTWLATLEYSNAPIDLRERERQTEPNPTNRSARVRWRTTQRQIVATRDANGKPYLNSAGDQFAPEARQRSVTDIIVLVTKSVANLPAWILTLDNRVSSAPFSVRGVTFPAGTLRLANLDIGDEQDEGNVTFLNTSFELHYHKEGWNRFELDRGYRIIDPTNASNRVKMFDDEGHELDEPALLDGAGGKLVDPSVSNAVYIEFQDLQEADFGVLNSLVI
ncbi:MAG: hypothetical protein AAFZ07_20235 [Actinomycetota bacterium]